MPLGEVSSPMVGWPGFCERFPAECKQPKDKRIMVLSQNVWDTLVLVNQAVNTTITSITDQNHWGVSERWDLPTDFMGDCEDFALLKRKLLIERGFERSALLITVVNDERQNGEGHAVLSVVTNKGTYILDQHYDNPMPWNHPDLKYRYVKRQLETDWNTWVRIK